MWLDMQLQGTKKKIDIYLYIRYISIYIMKEEELSGGREAMKLLNVLKEG